MGEVAPPPQPPEGYQCQCLHLPNDCRLAGAEFRHLFIVQYAPGHFGRPGRCTIDHTLSCSPHGAVLQATEVPVRKGAHIIPIDVAMTRDCHCPATALSLAL